MVDALDALLDYERQRWQADYDPNQPRDPHGRWTAGGGEAVKVHGTFGKARPAFSAPGEDATKGGLSYEIEGNLARHHVINEASRYGEAVRDLKPDDNSRDAEALRMIDTVLQADLRGHDVLSVYALKHGQVVGAGSLNEDVNSPDNAEIAALGTTLHGEGVGSAILAELIEQAHGRGYANVRIRPVEEALPFYKKMGFTWEVSETGGQSKMMRRPTVPLLPGEPGSALYESNPMVQEFRESLARSGDVFYHGTSGEAAKAILKHGIEAGHHGGGDDWASKHHGVGIAKARAGGRAMSVYITPSEKVAEMFARIAAGETKSKAIVFEVKVPKDKLQELRIDERGGREYLGKMIRYQGKIPPSWIKQHFEVSGKGALAGIDAAAQDSLPVYIIVLAKPDVSDAYVLVSDAAPSRDPTGTAMLRSRFGADMEKRFVHLRRLVSASPGLFSLTSVHGAPLESFGKWLHEAALQVVLGGQGAWMRPALAQATEMGATRALEGRTGHSEASRLVDPYQALAVAELKGVLAAMETQAARVFSEGMASRWTAAQLARAVNDRIRAIGSTRAAAVVAYMVVKAFNDTLLHELAAQGETHVGVIPETEAHTHIGDAARKTPQKRHGKTGRFVAYTKKPSAYKIRKAREAERRLQALGEVDVITAGDDLVCEECESIADDGPYPINEALGLIPAHPGCRCSFSRVRRVRDENPYHQPAGAPGGIGGQFAPKGAGEGAAAAPAAKPDFTVAAATKPGMWQVFHKGEPFGFAVESKLLAEQQAANLNIYSVPKPIEPVYKAEKKYNAVLGEHYAVTKNGKTFTAPYPSLAVAEKAAANYNATGTHGGVTPSIEAATEKIAAAFAPPPEPNYTAKQVHGGWQILAQGSPFGSVLATQEAAEKGAAALNAKAAAIAAPQPPLTATQQKVLEAAKTAPQTSALAWLSKSEKLALPGDVEKATDPATKKVKGLTLGTEKAVAAIQAGLIEPEQIDTAGFDKVDLNEIQRARGVWEAERDRIAFLAMPETTQAEKEEKLGKAIELMAKSEQWKGAPDTQTRIIKDLADLQLGKRPATEAYAAAAARTSRVVYHRHAYRLAGLVGEQRRAEFVEGLAKQIKADDPAVAELVQKVKQSDKGEDIDLAAAKYGFKYPDEAFRSRYGSGKFSADEINELRAAYELSPTHKAEVAAEAKRQAEITAKAVAAVAKLKADITAGKIKIDPAVIDVGGDAWNKSTALRLEAEYQSAKPALVELENKLTGERGGAVAAGDWNDLSGDMQEKVQDVWKQDNYSSYYDSEVNNWAENSGEEDAKSKLAWDFMKGDDIDWADEAVKEWREEREKVGKPDLETPIEAEPEPPLPRVPYADDQLVDALKIESESGHVTVSFDDKKLQHPDTRIEKQTNLPGVEEPDFATALTTEMRNSLLATIKDAFDNRAQDVQNHMDPPEYLVESTHEQLDEMWDQMEDDQKYGYAKDAGLLDQMGDLSGVAGVAALKPHGTGRGDPLNDESDDVYRGTQAMARQMSVNRAAQLIKERGLMEGIGKKVAGEFDDEALRGSLREHDSVLWQAWKDSSTSGGGQLLQLAAADELGGRLNEKQITHGREQLIKDADRNYADIGGYEGVKAYLRAKWETTQYLLDQAQQPSIKAYRGIAIDASEREPYEKVSDAQGISKAAYTRLSEAKLKRNGCASFSTDASVSNGWDGSERTVIRAEVPRTAVISVPAYGINVHSEHEVVLAGTAWKEWDAYYTDAPTFEDIPIHGGKVQAKGEHARDA